MFKKVFGEQSGSRIEKLAREYFLKNNCNDTFEKFSFELIGYLTHNFDATIHDLVNNEPIDNWVGSVFENLKINREYAIEKYQFKPVAIKGLDFCKKCKGDEFFYWQAQTRGNDEQTTTFRKCAKCP